MGFQCRFSGAPTTADRLRDPLAALAVTGGGVASAATGAEITNMGLAVTGHGACLTAQSPPGTAITQEQCTNADNQQWVYLGTPTETNPSQIQNVGTGQCTDASAFSNAAPVVQVACGVQAIGSYWNRNVSEFNDPVQGYRFKANVANYCLDLENGWATFGVSMQVWQCNPEPAIRTGTSSRRYRYRSWMI